jgi:hypothetical protein
MKTPDVLTPNREVAARAYEREAANKPPSMEDDKNELLRLAAYERSLPSGCLLPMGTISFVI